MEERRSTEDMVQEIKDHFDKSNMLPKWTDYGSVSKFKSVRRAIRRGHVNLYLGIAYPNRLFNNRKPTSGKDFNENKKKLYGQFRVQ